MPKRQSNAAAADYESDGGFVEDAAPSHKSKKAKTATSKSGNDASGKSLSWSKGDGGGAGTSWELSKTRRVAISEFNRKTLVDIREFYEKDGEKLPGKKGIMLTTEQFQNFLDALPDLLAGLEKKGVQLKVPDLSAGSSREEKVKQEDEDEDDEDDDDDSGDDDE